MNLSWYLAESTNSGTGTQSRCNVTAHLHARHLLPCNVGDCILLWLMGLVSLVIGDFGLKNTPMRPLYGQGRFKSIHDMSSDSVHLTCASTCARSRRVTQTLPASTDHSGHVATLLPRACESLSRESDPQRYCLPSMHCPRCVFHTLYARRSFPDKTPSYKRYSSSTLLFASTDCNPESFLA